MRRQDKASAVQAADRRGPRVLAAAERGALTLAQMNDILGMIGQEGVR